MKQIVKVQKSIVSTGAPTVLVYNRDKSFVRESSANEPDVTGQFKEGEFKFYCMAETGFMKLTLLERVPDQDW
jgi:hypothetical protein